VLCDCEIALIIFSSSNKLYQYASTDMDKVLLKYTEYNEPHESLTNKNIIEALNKKEHKNGGCSPDSPGEDVDATDYTLTPRTEAKYNKIDEDFQMMMQRTQHMSNGAQRASGGYAMPVSVPVNAGPYGDGSILHASPQMGGGGGHPSVSPRPSSSSGMLDVGNNGYPPASNSSPLPDSPPPSASSALKGGGASGGGGGGGANMIARSLSPQTSHLTSHIQRPTNLRVVIPGPQSGLSLSGHDRGGGSSLNTPVVSLQTPSLSGLYQSSYSSHGGGVNTAQGQEFSLSSSDLGLTSLHSVHSAWGAPVGSNSSGLVHHPGHLSSNIHLGSVSHLTVPSAVNQRPPSAPLSPSPVALKIKSEPISPPSLQGGMGLGQTLAPPTGMSLMQRPPSSSDHLSPSGHLTPTGSSPDPGHHSHSEYDPMPLHKRPRIAEGWGAS